jgi:hypothetical protein
MMKFKTMNLKEVTRLDGFLFDMWVSHQKVFKKKMKAWTIDVTTIKVVEALCHPIYNRAGRSQSSIVNELLIRGLLHLEEESNESTTDSE